MKTLMFICLGMFSGLVVSATFEVNLTIQDHVDEDPGDGVCEIAAGDGFCTLRAAIMEAEANNTFDVITIPAGRTVSLTIGTPQNSNASSGDLDITSPLRIETVGDNILPDDYAVIDATDLNDRIFDLRFARGITMRRLRLTGGNPGTTLENIHAGGAVRISSSTATGTSNRITFDQVRFDRNDAFDGGALAILDSTNEVNVINSVFEVNSSTENGSAIYAEESNLNLEQTSFFGNLAEDGPIREVIYLLRESNSAIEANITNSTLLGLGTSNNLLQSGINAKGIPTRLRHVTISDFDDIGVRMVTRDGVTAAPRLTVHNSMIVDNEVDCEMGEDTAITSVSSNYTDDNNNNNCNIPVNFLVADSGLSSWRRDDLNYHYIRVPEVDSPAIDSASTPICTDFDQLGNIRPVDGNFVDELNQCDRGAIEVNRDLIFADGFES